ncbi:MAG: ATP synthase F0 subunit C [Bacilli bacterium]|nr:ATP synthase F0 subunit C [Bacilli bacterium]
MDINTGLVAIGAGIAMISAFGSSIGEGMIAAKAIEGMYRNPEMANKLRSNMIVGIALDETCGIYALLIAILIIFVLGGK